MSQPKASVLITTYEDDLRMEITLRAFTRQVTTQPFEIIVVNDGGRSDTEAMLHRVWDDYSKIIPATPSLIALHYYYLNPPSSDFRLAQARNLGLRHITTQQTIVCDCDTAPNPSMVEAHMQAFDRQHVLVGVRKHVRREAVEQVTNPAECDHAWLFKNAYQDDDRVNGVNPTLRQRYLGISDYSRPWEVTWGCNFSFPTERATSIGGFDEEFIGWGGEDEDLARRLFRQGARFKPLPESYVYHLDHLRRTQQVASQIFYRKMDMDVIRNGGPMTIDPHPTYIGHVSVGESS